jgi:tetratricopeptide (TPR) repeat protein
MVRSSLLFFTLGLVLLAGTVTRSTAQETAAAGSAAEAEDLLAKGMVLHRAGDLLGAIQSYQVALEILPNRADIRSNLGAAYAGLGRYADAIEEYKRALAARDDSSVRLNLALALYKSGDPAEAVPEFQRVLQADRENHQAPLLLADCLLQLGRDQDVIDALTPREAAYADDLAYAYLLGTALLKRGETDKGQVLIDRIFRQGESAEGHLLMGMAHLNSRDYQNAVSELTRAVALNPSLPSLQTVYGRALVASGDREKGIRAYRTALEQSPADFDANLQLGILYRIDRQYELAMRHLKRAETVRPRDVALRHALAATELGLGDPEKARELLEEVARQVPDFVDAHVLLATTYYRLQRKEDGDRERAIIDELNAQSQAKQPVAGGADAGTPAQAPAAGATAGAPPEPR